MTSTASRKPPPEPQLAALLHGLHLRGLAVGVDDAVRIAAVFRYADRWSRERRVQVLKALVARSDEERLLVEQLAPHLFVTTEDVPEREEVVAVSVRLIDEEKDQETETGNGRLGSESATKQVPTAQAPSERAAVPEEGLKAEQRKQAAFDDVPARQPSGERSQQVLIEGAGPHQAASGLERLAGSEGPRTYRLEIFEPTTPLDRSLVHEAAFHLSAPSVPALAPWLEGHRTVEATVAQGGRLCLRYAIRLTHSPVLFLEDVSQTMARWPDHGRQFVEALERQGNDVVRCFMCGTPDALSSDRRMSRPLQWSQVVESLGDPTILVLSDAKSLDRTMARRVDWLGVFRKAVWLHPQPPELWGLGARWLAGQARVVPLSDEGLLRLTTPRLDSGELPPRWRPSRSCGGADATARLSAIRAAVGVEAFWWLCAGAVFDSLHTLSARLWWKLAEEIVEAPLSGVQRVWALPDVSVFSDGTVRLRDDLGRALLENLERERPELLVDIVDWCTDVIARDLERLPADSLATVSARAQRGYFRVLDGRQREWGLQDLEILKSEGYGKWIHEPVQEILRSSELARSPGEVAEGPLGMRFRYVPAGRFRMGSPEGEPGRFARETPHEVELTRGFWLGETPVTQSQWRQVMGNSPSRFSAGGDDCPVETVTWYDAVAFANRLSEMAGLPVCYELECTGTPGERGYACAKAELKRLDCEGYRLPTEAEWERAVRAGTDSAVYTGTFTIKEDGTSPQLERIAWYEANSRQQIHPIRGKAPNAWGLFDMLGNVWEWCGDAYAEYPTKTQRDPFVHEGSGRVYRGGSWLYVAQRVRAASRLWDEPGNCHDSLGFRLARGQGELGSPAAGARHPGKGDRLGRRCQAPR